MSITSRSFSSHKYKYGFNGMEKDDELKGEGNSYTTHFRQYDPRLGRWLSIDPKTDKFPWQSPYVSMDNNPIILNDPNGDCPTCATAAFEATLAGLVEVAIQVGTLMATQNMDFQTALKNVDYKKVAAEMLLTMAISTFIPGSGAERAFVKTIGNKNVRYVIGIGVDLVVDVMKSGLKDYISDGELKDFETYAMNAVTSLGVGRTVDKVVAPGTVAKIKNTTSSSKGQLKDATRLYDKSIENLKKNIVKGGDTSGNVARTNKLSQRLNDAHNEYTKAFVKEKIVAKAKDFVKKPISNTANATRKKVIGK